MTSKEHKDYLIKRYEVYKGRHVSDCYSKPSSRKCSIENTIIKEMNELNGVGYTVMGFNCHFFTCAYCFKKEGHWYLRFITSTKTEDIYLTEQDIKELDLG